MASDSYLDQGVAAVKAGDRGSARRFLCQALQADPGNEIAFLWLSAALGTPQARAFCLQRVLEINPANQVARRGLEALHQPLPAPGSEVPSDAVYRQPVVHPPSPQPSWTLASQNLSAAVAVPDRAEARTALAAEPQAVAPTAVFVPKRRGGVLGRVARYSVVRAAGLVLSVVVAVYLTILIANLGGYVDKVVAANIDIAVGMLGQTDEFRFMPTEERQEAIAQIREAMYQGAGLYEPFLLRTIRWLRQGLTIDWGESRVARVMSFGTISQEVSKVILDRLPRTLLLFGTANLFLFFTSIFLALFMTRKYGSWLDKLIISLTPLSSVPAWVYGVVLNIALMRLLGGVFSGGTFDSWPRDFTLAHLPYFLRYLLLPFLAIFLSGIFQSVYAWRTFFLLYASEDHVEMAKAAGLPPRLIERRHILRLGLPNVITSFALLMITLWQEVVALEWFFNVEGIGRLLIRALGVYDTATVVGLVVTFAYLLAITVFVLDIVYAFVDPRVRIGDQGQTLRAAARKDGRRFWPRFRRVRRQKPAWQPRFSAAGFSLRRSLKALADGIKGLARGIAGLRSLLPELVHYPSLVVGLAIISFLVGVSIYTVIAFPYQESIYKWRGDNDAWARNPQRALPAWVNFFRKNDLPSTIILDSREQPLLPDGTPIKTVQIVSEDMTQISFSFPFDYPYEGFPQEVALHVDAQFERKKPLLNLIWSKPEGGAAGAGQEIDIGGFTITSSFDYLATQDERLQRKLGGQSPVQGLFIDPASDSQAAGSPAALPGKYKLEVNGFVFEEGADLEAELIVYGEVYGLAGTDHNRRDVMLALLWGTPVALAFGLLAAFGTSVTTMVIAGVGVWFGGRVDGVIQRITEVNMILPFLPVSIMIYTLYSKSFWVILGVTVALSIFGAAIKNYRAIFLQLKEAPYVEAALAYGAGNWRIIFRYLVPRIGAILIPQLVILVPAYVFLEATLAFLGVSDPLLPTWGKLVVEALAHSLQSSDYHLVLIPVAALMFTGFGFALVGIALERILDPRLRRR
jgi:peptide/nickel transport system permease protein